MTEYPEKTESNPLTILLRVLVSPSRSLAKKLFFSSAIRLPPFYPDYHQVRSLSIRLTLTSVDTPFSCIVIP